jgi:hypothetical protein
MGVKGKQNKTKQNKNVWQDTDIISDRRYTEIGCGSVCGSGGGEGEGCRHLDDNLINQNE